MAGRNPYQGGGKPKIPRRLLEFDDLYQAVQNLLYGFQNTKDMMILLPEERTDVQGRTLPDPVSNGVWAWNHDASAPRYFTPEQFYAEMPVSLHLDQLQDLHAQTLALRNQAQGFRDSALLFANDSTVSAGLSSGFASQAQGFANGAASSKLDADEAATQAAGSASASQVHAISSQTSAQTAGTHATTAQTNANKAQAWASNPVGVPVEANLYSARHYAQEAANAATGSMRFKGTWDASVGSYPDAPATGDFYRITVAGTISGRELNPGDQIFFDGAGWDHIDNTDRVMSVNGQTGNVQLTSEQIAGFGSLAAKDQADWTTDLINIPDLAPRSHTHNKGEVGLSNVDNTSDMAKPVSTATATALAAKANITHSHDISNITGLQPALDGKADASHTHPQSDVTNLVDDLAAKASRENPTFGGGYMRIGTYGPTHTVSGGHFESYFSENMPAAGANWRLMARDGAGGLVPLRLDVSGEVVSGGGFVTQGNSYQIRSGNTIQGRLQHNGTNLYMSSDVGDLFLRPAGFGSSANQLWLQAGAGTTDPAIVAYGNLHVGKGNSFVSVGAAADHVGGGIANFNSVGAQPQLGVFAGNGSGNAGMIYLRPDGRSSAVGQSTFGTTAANIGTAVNVTGWVKSTVDMEVSGTDVGFKSMPTTGRQVKFGSNNNSNSGIYNVSNATWMLRWNSSMQAYMQCTVLELGDTSGIGIILHPDGKMYRSNANSRTTRTSVPRVFVQSADPGAAAATGDLWIW